MHLKPFQTNILSFLKPVLQATAEQVCLLIHPHTLGKVPPNCALPPGAETRCSEAQQRLSHWPARWHLGPENRPGALAVTPRGDLWSLDSWMFSVSQSWCQER